MEGYWEKQHINISKIEEEGVKYEVPNLLFRFEMFIFFKLPKKKRTLLLLLYKQYMETQSLPKGLAGLWLKLCLFSPHCCCQYPCHPPIITKGLEDMGMGFITLTLELHNGAASRAGDPGTAQDMVAGYLHQDNDHCVHCQPQQFPHPVTSQLYDIQPVRSPRCGNNNSQSQLSGSSVQSIRALLNSASPLVNFLSTSPPGPQPDALIRGN